MIGPRRVWSAIAIGSGLLAMATGPGAGVDAAGRTDAAAVQRGGGTPPAATTQKPGEGVWRNYDFVPGSTVWKATDFTAEPVGRFPSKQIEFVSGNMQTVEMDGEKAIEVSASSRFKLPLPAVLPAGFTLEFMLHIPALNFTTSVFFSSPTTALAKYPHDYVQIYSRPGIYRQGREVSNLLMQGLPDRWVSVKLQVDDTYAILYVDSERAAQVPTANFARSNAIEIRAEGNQRLKTYLKDFVVAVGVGKLYDALMKTGTFTTRGILFDVNSDRIRPESTPALTEILSTLKEHGTLRIVIEGHTDNTGDDAGNLALSDRRAKSVVAYLTQQGIAATRLAAEGKGETAPAADNATAEGRQQNRRVVIRVAK